MTAGTVTSRLLGQWNAETFATDHAPTGTSVLAD
jgi:hypothetical protein